MGWCWIMLEWVLFILVVISIYSAIYYAIIKPYVRAHKKCYVCGKPIGRKKTVRDPNANEYFHYDCYVEMNKDKLF